MAETFSFTEGTANFKTGAVTVPVTYCRDVQATLTIGYHRYRPPYSTTYQFIETGREATLSIGQMHSQKQLGVMFDGATAGGIHVQLIHAAAGVTSNLWLYSGVIDSHSMNGSEGNVMQRSLVGRFQSWTET